MVTAARRSLLSAPAFAPTRIPGCRLWLAADRIEGLADDGAVGTWGDLSGYGNNATQGTGSAKPTYKTSILNDKPIVRFDGDTMSGSLAAISTQAHSAFLVYRKSNATFGVILCSSDGALQYLSANGSAPDYDTGDDYHYPTAHLGIKIANNQTANFVICSVVAGTAITTPYKNGSAGSSGAADAASKTNYILGSYDGAQYFFSGDIAEIVIYNRALISAERLRVERYLSHKWGIVIT